MKLINYTKNILKFFPSYLYDLNKEWIIILVENEDEKKEVLRKINENYDKLAKFRISILDDARLFELLTADPKDITLEEILKLKDPDVEYSIISDVFLFFILTNIFMYIHKRQNVADFRKKILTVRKANAEGTPIGKYLYKEMLKDLSSLEE